MLVKCLLIYFTKDNKVLSVKFFKTDWHQVASEFNYDIPEEEIPSPGQIVSYIEQLPEDEYNDWIVEKIDLGEKHTDNKFGNGLFEVSR
tara:strand:- start:730 stop:996 length:267 start_codon:yes stop_codon:yes gene_type:complete